MNTGETIALIKAFGNGGGGSSLPSVTSSDNGKVLAVKDGAWAAQQKKFIVTLTPTSPDFSGTMDKTVAEITAAYNAGQEIVFDIPSLYVKAHAFEFAISGGDVQAGSVVTYRTGDSHLLIEILTDAVDSTYETHIYSLTPAS